MASSREYLDFVMEQLPEGADFRAMMGEFVLYHRGKVIGGVYDNRLLLKITPTSAALLPDAPRELPYPGAKEMLLADADDHAGLERVVTEMWAELPAPKKRRNVTG